MRKLNALAFEGRMVKLISKIITRNKRNGNILTSVIEPAIAIILMPLMNYLTFMLCPSRTIKVHIWMYISRDKLG